MSKNPMCDGSRCRSSQGQVRVLPHGDNNHILCHTCYLAEIAYRKERNKELDPNVRYDLPKWEDLKIYEV